ncbi:hypothetical protein CEE37_13110 [candidate division LCP-89 bacterium B3_LCP]|uniref:Uncharacterized protein n=1 Tax=candidate division LCP-89 bacterium B3_LCP TaxID=2012998 RepID=A0A532UU55_UNCL8|nr:MAG: hypothetical protein CEE37_13110 [candidate division LCP-89 bacterium B3_LCP]
MIQISRTIRIYFFRNGSSELLKVATLNFKKNDSSLYIIPYARNNSYRIGQKSFAQHDIEATLKFNENETSENIPHLSIHNSGQVHVRIPQLNQIIGPCKIPSFSRLNGEHVASITCDSFDALQIEEENKKHKNSQRIAIKIGDNEESRRVLICINGNEERFVVEDCYSYFHVKHKPEGLKNPVWVGIFSIPQDRLNAPDVEPGVTIISGWDPTDRSVKQEDFLYIRGL